MPGKIAKMVGDSIRTKLNEVRSESEKSLSRPEKKREPKEKIGTQPLFPGIPGVLLMP